MQDGINYIGFRNAVLITLLCLCIINKPSCQENTSQKFERISSENYKPERGLSQNSIFCMMQDRQGFLWFGTWDGLNKYDGYNFTIYRPEPHLKKQSLSDKTIVSIFEDSKGLIWIGTWHGLNILNRHTGEVTKIMKSGQGLPGLKSDTINCFSDDGQGNIWLGTTRGITVWNTAKKKFVINYQAVAGKNTVSNANITSVISSDHEMWVGTWKGLNRYDKLTGKFRYFFRKPGDPASLSSDTINCLFYDKKGILWIGTRGGLNAYNIKSERFLTFRHDARKPNSLVNNNVSCILEDKEGDLWVGTQGGGLDRFDAVTSSFIHYQHNTNDPGSLSNDFISSLFEDRSGLIWVGTSWNGVNKLLKNTYRFNHTYPLSNDNNSLNSNLIWGFLENTPNELWIATNKGVNILDRKSGKYRYLMAIPGNKNLISNNKTRCFYKDKNANIWIGTEDGGINVIRQKTKEIIHYYHDYRDPYSLASNHVNGFCEDRDGTLWIATHGGLDRYLEESGKFKHLHHSQNDTGSIASDVVWCAYIDKENNLWACTEEGLCLFNRETEKFRTYSHDPDKAHSLSINDVFSIFEDSPGSYWVATSGGGLCHFNKETGWFKTYTEQDGLANNVVYNILQDASGNLWMSTNYGISRFDPANELFYNYDVKDGVQSNEFNFSSALMTSSGEMIFGGMNGFNIFDPGKIRKNFFKPPVLVTSFRLFNELFHNEFSSGDTIYLKHNQNFFTILFASLNFTNPLKNKFRYILEGYDGRWSNADANHHFADYTKVSPATYVFRLKGSNNDGVWSEKEFYLTIIISKPWYSTWLFRILSILVLAGLVAFFIYRRIRKFRQKHEMEKKFLSLENQMLDTERKALQLQMNPHFIFNSMNSIQSFILANDTEQAINYLAKFSHLMRLILSNSREAYVLLSQELKAITFYMDIEQLRFEGKFTYQLILDPGIDPEILEIPPMLLQPYIENAIIHGLIHKPDTGHLIVHVTKRASFLSIIIEDDGIGRLKAGEILEISGIRRKSQGMFITGKRLDLLRTSHSRNFAVRIIDLKDEQGIGKGTRVELDIVPKMIGKVIEK